MPKKTIIVYVCENENCKLEDQDGSKFAHDVPLQLGDDKKKGILCKDCKDEHDEYMGRYFWEDEDGGETPEADDYDPTTDRAFAKYTHEQALHHRAAKLWSVGPKSTMKVAERPKGLKGPASDKVITAYDAYLEELRAKVGAADAAVNGNGKST